MAQSVKRPVLGFGSGPDLIVCVFKPRDRLCMDSMESAWDFSLPLSLSASPWLALSLSKNKH